MRICYTLQGKRSSSVIEFIYYPILRKYEHQISYLRKRIHIEYMI